MVFVFVFVFVFLYFVFALYVSLAYVWQLAERKQILGQYLVVYYYQVRNVFIDLFI